MKKLLIAVFGVLLLTGADYAQKYPTGTPLAVVKSPSNHTDGYVLAWDNATGRYIEAVDAGGVGSNYTSSNARNDTGFSNATGGIVTYDLTRNVGVGISSPLAKLHVKGSGTGTGFALRISDSAGTDRLVVTDAGNVGIGTTAPNYNFVVKGSSVGGYPNSSFSIDIVSSDYGPTIRGTAGIDNSSRIYFGSPPTLMNNVALTYGQSSSFSTKYDTGLNAFTLTNSTGARKIYLTNSTVAFEVISVGIGTTAPSEKLHVAGGNVTVDAGYFYLGNASQLIGFGGDVSGPANSLQIVAGTVGPSELASTAVAAGVYGSGTLVPQFTVDADGRLTNVTNVSITAGGSGDGNASNLTTGTVSIDRYSAYGDLGAESKIGTGATQVSAGDHAHGGVYEPAGVTVSDISDFTASVDANANVSASKTHRENTTIHTNQTERDAWNAKQAGDSTLTDIADGTIAENLVNTANPWAADEIVSTVIHEGESAATLINLNASNLTNKDNFVALATNTTGNYVATNAATLPVMVSGADAEGATKTLSLAGLTANGTANQDVVVSNGTLGWKYKTIVAGNSNVTVTHNAENISISSIDTTGAGGSSQWNTTGSEIYLNTSYSNVGIGITDPAYVLDVNGTTRVTALNVSGTGAAFINATNNLTIQANPRIIFNTTVVFTPTATTPVNPVEGTEYMNATNHIKYTWNGTAWRAHW